MRRNLGVNGNWVAVQELSLSYIIPLYRRIKWKMKWKLREYRDLWNWAAAKDLD